MFNYSLLMNITDNEYGILLNINVLCHRFLSAFAKHKFYMLIMKPVLFSKTI